MRLPSIPVISVGIITAASLAALFFACGKVEAPEEPLARVQQLDGDWVDWDLYDTVDLITMTLYRNDERPEEPMGHIMYDSLSVNEHRRWNEHALWGDAEWGHIIFLRALNDDTYFYPTGADSSYTPQQQFSSHKGTAWVPLSVNYSWSVYPYQNAWTDVRPCIAVRVGMQHFYKLIFQEKPTRFRILEY